MMNRLASSGFLLLLATSTLPGCYLNYQKRQLLKDDFRTDDVTVPLALIKVSIVDKRKGVESRPLKVPMWSLRPSDSVQPALMDKHKSIIEQEIARYCRDGRQQVLVVAEVIRASQGFEGTPTRGRDLAEVEMRLTFIDPVSRQTLFWSKGKYFAHVDSMTFTQSFSDALFEKTLKVAVYENMRQVKEEFFPE
jgi:hypothetical protein